MTDTTDTPDDPTHGEVIDAPDVSGTWLPPAAAASRLGVSERTLWRHVNAGRYHKRVTAGRAEILVPGSGVAPDNPDTPRTPVLPDADRQVSLALVAELRRRLDEETDRQRRLSVKVERQALEIGRLQAQLAAEREARERAEERVRKMEARRWWERRWW